MMMDVNEVINHLPHRYPFLMIDRVVALTEGESVRAIKNITINEPIFQGHFPSYPVFPGVLILEAMAQAAAILGFKSVGVKPDENTLHLYVGIEKARFKRQVVPGDQLVLDVKILRQKRNIYVFSRQASVDDQLACSAEIMIAHSQVPQGQAFQGGASQ